MAEKPAQLTLLDFIDWCIRNIDTDKLAALLTEYGYNRYDSETIAEAVNDPEFRDDFGALLRSSLGEDKSYAELTRAAGEITAADWVKIAKSNSFAKATGTTTTTTLPWWQTVLQVIGGAADVLAPKTTTTVTTPPATTTTGSSNFMWIILAVVILAVVVILWLSTARKK